MARRPTRDDFADPTLQQLRAVRLGLLRFHKTLIDTERRHFERQSGRLSSGQFLQALLQDPYFAWLRPYSALIAEIDEALAAEEPLEPARARAFVEQVRALVALSAEEDAAPATRLGELRRANPEILLAHIELTARIDAALE